MNTKPLQLDKRVELKCSKADYRRWQTHAKKLKTPVSEFLRNAANAEVARVDTLAKNVSK